MKLLFDQNLSFKLATLLIEQFPGSTHVNAHTLQEDDDIKVWEYAKEHSYTIVSKDIDFYEISLVKGHPPKIIWLRIGNLPTSEVKSVLEKRQKEIIAFADDDSLACLEIYRN